ncbi:MAG TPA: hypothetical protein VFH06_02470 [Candidatus Saccharimonadales bacterium]|nr:hypothetical protein [Candidatus Saccharimonadales bacterium]
MAQSKKQTPQKKKYLFTALIAIVVIGIFHIWLSLTNPYASWNIVQQPYITTVAENRIEAKKQFDLHVYSGVAAQAVGYYKSGFLIVQNAYTGSPKAPTSNPNEIIDYIHNLRFDPSKPYLISGDQFSVLYPRNLGVFYNSLLDPKTIHNQKDWENRQRIYLQSALYALDAFTNGDTLTTTIVPTGAKSVALTEVHPGSVPSDTLYGILYAFNALQNDSPYKNSPYKLQTTKTVRDILASRRADLQKLLGIYLSQVQDPHTKLIRNDLHLAAARDGVTRESSFYDNVILWKTLSLANDLGIQSTPDSQLAALHEVILARYWDESEGHFKDDIRNHDPKTNYSSDWLIALPTGFLSAANPAHLPYIEKSIHFIRDQHIADPFPIKYQAKLSAKDVPWVVKTFVPNYGGDAIWSYWGAQYITLLADTYEQTHNLSYLTDATQAVQKYRQKMAETRGFPETFTANGDFLQNGVYKSIRQTGWVVQFEAAEQKVNAYE